MYAQSVRYHEEERNGITAIDEEAIHQVTSDAQSTLHRVAVRHLIILSLQAFSSLYVVYVPLSFSHDAEPPLLTSSSSL